MPQAPVMVGPVPAWIAVDEVGDSAVVETFARDGPRGQVTFKVDYDQRYTLLKHLIGSVTANGRTVVRIPPFAFPPNPNLYAWEVGEIRGVGKPSFGDDGFPVYKQCLVPTTFLKQPWDFQALDYGGQNDPSGQPWTTTKFRISAEIYQPPDGEYFLGPFPGGKKIDAAGVGLTVPRVEISMTRMFMPFVPLDEVMDLIGSVNDAPVYFANRTFDRGNLLFVGVNTEPASDPTGERCEQIEYTFLGNHSHEWNEFMAVDGTYQYLNTKANGTGDPPFAYTSFGNLP